MEYSLESAVEIIRAVKKRYKEVCGTQFFNREFTYGEETHVLKNYGDNISGELSLENRSKFGIKRRRPKGTFLPIASLFSNEAMAFNLFGNKNAEITENDCIHSGKYKVEYKYVLAKSGASTYNAPISVDVKLLNAKEGNLVCINFDFVDWLFLGFSGLRASYLDKKRYEVGGNGEVFVKIFSELILDAETLKTEYLPRHKALNSVFLVKQAAILYEYACEGILDGISKLDIVLSNWQISQTGNLSEKTAVEYKMKTELFYEEWESFCELILPVKELFGKLGIELNFKFIPYCELAKFVSMSKKNSKFFERYCI